MIPVAAAMVKATLASVAMLAHPAANTMPAVPASYVVKAGDTLSGIASRYKTPGGWDSVYADNPGINNPDVIKVGVRLRLPYRAMHRAWSPPDVPRTAHYRARHASGTYVPKHASGTYSGSGSMQQCIIRVESQGDSQAMNSSGHYGLYQYDYATWVANGGNPATFGHATIAEQNQVFDNTVANSGYSAWVPYEHGAC